jgi:hypothetical protein
MEPRGSIQGSQPLSRYGDQSLDLTLGITRAVLQQPSLGFHRFEPVVWNDVATVPGNVTYPTRNFALTLTAVFVQKCSTFTELSDVFLSRCSCMSPCRWDYIFIDENVDVWRVVSEDSDLSIGLSC